MSKAQREHLRYMLWDFMITCLENRGTGTSVDQVDAFTRALQEWHNLADDVEVMP